MQDQDLFLLFKPLLKFFLTIFYLLSFKIVLFSIHILALESPNFHLHSQWTGQGLQMSSLFINTNNYYYIYHKDSCISRTCAIKPHPQFSSVTLKKKIKTRKSHSYRSFVHSDLNKLINSEIPFKSFSLIDFPIPCDCQQLSS